MYREFSLFERNIEQVRELASIYQYLEDTITAPISFDDILRSQVVYSVSAFDKLIHDLVRVGMVDIFMGRRVATPKYRSEVISLKLYDELNSASVPPKEVIFEQAIFENFTPVWSSDISACCMRLLWQFCNSAESGCHFSTCYLARSHHPFSNHHQTAAIT